MQNINSDQLRKRLAKHTRKMNWLAEQNDLIVATLKQRGLQAIEPDNNDVAIHPCVMQLDKLGEALFRTQFEPKRREEIPLTSDELKAGGWWCEKVDEATIEALIGLDIPTHYQWDIGSSPIAMSTTSGVASNHPSCFLGDGWKQVHRHGNNFYWGAPSDQAN